MAIVLNLNDSVASRFLTEYYYYTKGNRKRVVSVNSFEATNGVKLLYTKISKFSHQSKSVPLGK